MTDCTTKEIRLVRLRCLSTWRNIIKFLALFYKESHCYSSLIFQLIILNCALPVFSPLVLKQLPYFRITSAIRAKKRLGSFHNTSFPDILLPKLSVGLPHPCPDWLKFTNDITPSCVNIDVHVSFCPTWSPCRFRSPLVHSCITYRLGYLFLRGKERRFAGEEDGDASCR